MIERNGLRVEQRVFCYLGCDWIICDALTKLMKGQLESDDGSLAAVVGWGHRRLKGVFLN